MTRFRKWWIYLSVAAVLAWALAGLELGQLGDARTGVRRTARIAFAYFALVYVARPVAAVFGWSALAR